MEQESNLRRKIFTTAPLVLISFMGTPSAEAKTGQSKSVQFASRSSPSRATTADPLKALEGLVKAKEELLVAKNDYLKKKDFEGLREYLSEKAVNMNAFEGNALSILASNMISAEDKKEIGTIRRYGIGADVMIMYGGLNAEIDEANDEPDAAAAQKFLTRTIESLDEVISICQNNGL